MFDKRLRKTGGVKAASLRRNGFVSFKNAEGVKALREMQVPASAPQHRAIIQHLCLLQGKYIGNNSITIRKSEYQDRSLGAGHQRHRN